MTLALVSGATGALGSAITLAFLHAGYDVLAGHRHTRAFERLVAKAAPASGTLFPWQCDLRSVTRDHLSRDLALWAPIAVLVCAHGAPPCAIPTLSLGEEDVATVYETDVLSTLRLAQVVGAGMVQQRQGAMVFLSSAHAHQTYVARAPYVMSKAAICGLARALAVEWGPYNITVNSVSPWQVSGHTRSTAVAAQEQSQTGEDTEMLYRRRSPLGRLVTPHDVASTVLWVAENRSMTGQDVRIDCGVAASMWHRPFPGEGA